MECYDIRILSDNFHFDSAITIISQGKSSKQYVTIYEYPFDDRNQVLETNDDKMICTQIQILFSQIWGDFTLRQEWNFLE